ncbi:MAG: preprotein translocase subunit SecG [Bacteroidales bacterium]|nr:preprotein translocase subunit SecG [Bacteroidales bacterium]
MYTTLIVLIVIAAVLLVLIVLVQNSKGGGLASDLSAGTQFGGVAEQKSKLENYTWGLVIAIAVLSIIASVSGGSNAKQSQQESGVKQLMINQNAAPSIPQAPTMQSAPAN